ncbi:hypothetical protein BDW66DRAFT_140981 [Aspergillus desertorum]
MYQLRPPSKMAEITMSEFFTSGLPTKEASRRPGEVRKADVKPPSGAVFFSKADGATFHRSYLVNHQEHCCRYGRA